MFKLLLIAIYENIKIKINQIVYNLTDIYIHYIYLFKLIIKLYIFLKHLVRKIFIWTYNLLHYLFHELLIYSLIIHLILFFERVEFFFKSLFFLVFIIYLKKLYKYISVQYDIYILKFFNMISKLPLDKQTIIENNTNNLNFIFEKKKQVIEKAKNDEIQKILDEKEKKRKEFEENWYENEKKYWDEYFFDKELRCKTQKELNDLYLSGYKGRSNKISPLMQAEQEKAYKNKHNYEEDIIGDPTQEISKRIPTKESEIVDWVHETHKQWDKDKIYVLEKSIPDKIKIFIGDVIINFSEFLLKYFPNFSTLFLSFVILFTIAAWIQRFNFYNHTFYYKELIKYKFIRPIKEFFKRPHNVSYSPSLFVYDNQIKWKGWINSSFFSILKRIFKFIFYILSIFILKINVVICFYFIFYTIIIFYICSFMHYFLSKKIIKQI